MSRAAKETISRKQIVYYSDFITSFATHPLSSDIAKVTNAEAIKASLRNLLLMNYGEKFFDSTIGSNVYKTLFDPIDGFVINDIKDHIIHTVEYNEPRVKLIDVVVQAVDVNGTGNVNDENAVRATITFYIINTGETAVLDTILKRVR